MLSFSDYSDLYKLLTEVDNIKTEKAMNVDEDDVYNDVMKREKDILKHINDKANKNKTDVLNKHSILDHKVIDIFKNFVIFFEELIDRVTKSKNLKDIANIFLDEKYFFYFGVVLVVISITLLLF